MRRVNVTRKDETRLATIIRANRIANVYTNWLARENFFARLKEPINSHSVDFFILVISLDSILAFWTQVVGIVLNGVRSHSGTCLCIRQTFKRVWGSKATKLAAAKIGWLLSRVADNWAWKEREKTVWKRKKENNLRQWGLRQEENGKDVDNAALAKDFFFFSLPFSNFLLYFLLFVFFFFFNYSTQPTYSTRFSSPHTD